MLASALMIIDQQQGIDHPKLGPRNNPHAEQVMLSLLARWREMQWPIFHIKHRSLEPDSVFWPEQSGFDHKTEFLPLADECLIEKSVPCAFANNVTRQLFDSMSISALVVVGVATNNSVESSVRTAGNLGYKVTVIADACFAFDKVDFDGKMRSAQQVHAMSLANLNGEYAAVVDASEFLAKL